MRFCVAQMPTGAPLLPVTKTGSGDKQKAYIVRQNLCLKILLGLLLVVGSLSTALLFTTFEVSHKVGGAALTGVGAGRVGGIFYCRKMNVRLHVCMVVIKMHGCP